MASVLRRPDGRFGLTLRLRPAKLNSACSRHLRVRLLDDPAMMIGGDGGDDPRPAPRSPAPREDGLDRDSRPVSPKRMVPDRRPESDLPPSLAESSVGELSFPPETGPAILAR